MVTSYEEWMWMWMAFIVAQVLCMWFVKPSHLQRMHDIQIGPKQWTIRKDLAWKIISLPAIPSILLFYVNGGGLEHSWTNPQRIFVAFYCLHYLYRSVVFPRRLRTSEQRYSVFVILITWLYYIPMGYFLGDYFARVHVPQSHLDSVLFYIGIVIFLIGLCSTIIHDEILIRLRATPSSEYKIPSAGLFQRSSNAHYFSEIIEWFGFFLLTGAFPAFVHCGAIFILMLPQARKTHQWYQDYFGDQYPKNRNMLIPLSFRKK